MPIIWQRFFCVTDRIFRIINRIFDEVMNLIKDVSCTKAQLKPGFTNSKTRKAIELRIIKDYREKRQKSLTVLY